MTNDAFSKLKLITNNDLGQKHAPKDNSCIEEDIYNQILNAYENRLMSRRLKPATIKSSLDLINSFTTYTTLYPWEWKPSDFEDWSAYIYSIRKNSEATQRHKQNTIAKFQSFLVESPKLSELCKLSFGQKPIYICSNENLIPHRVEDENKEKRTAFTREHLKCLWNFFDRQIELAYKCNSKSLKVLQRDKTLYLVIYYYGLRANEVSHLDTTDFIHHPKRPEWDSFGGILVRHGKSSGGCPPKRRTVWTISTQAVDYLRWYLENIRPQFGFDESNALFLSERGHRISPSSITRNFKEYLKCAGLPYVNYSTHCLRHSYISHLSENLDLSPRFIQEQVGHTLLATTQMYTHLSHSFTDKQLTAVINRQINNFMKRG
jgi:site-specific recombinase XerD